MNRLMVVKCDTFCTSVGPDGGGGGGEEKREEVRYHFPSAESP